MPVEAARESADGRCFAQPQCPDITRTLTLKRRRARIPWIYLLYHRDRPRLAHIDEDRPLEVVTGQMWCERVKPWSGPADHLAERGKRDGVD